jgi:hypothetical protein
MGENYKMSRTDAELELGGPRGRPATQHSSTLGPPHRGKDGIHAAPTDPQANPGNAEPQLGIPQKHLKRDAPNRGHQTSINPPAFTAPIIKN